MLVEHHDYSIPPNAVINIRLDSKARGESFGPFLLGIEAAAAVAEKAKTLPHRPESRPPLPLPLRQRQEIQTLLRTVTPLHGARQFRPPKITGVIFPAKREHHPITVSTMPTRMPITAGSFFSPFFSPNRSRLPAKATSVLPRRRLITTATSELGSRSALK